MNREIEIVDTPDGTKCRIWVHTKELAELRQHGPTTTQLRRLVYDSHHQQENQNETLNTGKLHTHNGGRTRVGAGLTLNSTDSLMCLSPDLSACSRPGC